MSPAELAAALLLVVCCLYYLVAMVAARRPPAPRTATFLPPVSVLIPVRGLDRSFPECARSHARQKYPEFEILFASSDPADPVIPEIRRLAAEFPGRRIEAFHTEQDFGPNDKVNSLERLRAAARYEVLVVADSDVELEPDALSRTVAPLADPAVGLVHCLYRGLPAPGLASLLQALWISTDFQASVLVARLLGIPFALGAAMAMRRQELDRIGGFAPLAAYLADDFWLARRIAGLGKRIELSSSVVATALPEGNWRQVWRHRLRWGRTLRSCRRWGYAGVLVTFAVPLGILALAVELRLWPLAAAAVTFRLVTGLVVGAGLLRDLQVGRWFGLLPLADLFSFAVWAASLFGRQVEWRGRRYRLGRSGAGGDLKA